MDSQNQFAFWYNKDDNNLQAEDNDFLNTGLDTEDFGFDLNEIVREEEVDQMMETGLFEDINFQQKPAMASDSTLMDNNVLENCIVSGNIPVVSSSLPATLSQTVGSRSIKQLLQSPLKVGVDGEDMLKSTTSFVCNKTETLDPNEFVMTTTTTSPKVQDIKPSSILSGKVVVQGFPGQTVQIVQATPSTTTVVPTTNNTTSLQALLMSSKPVQQTHMQNTMQISAANVIDQRQHITTISPNNNNQPAQRFSIVHSNNQQQQVYQQLIHPQRDFDQQQQPCIITAGNNNSTSVISDSSQNFGSSPNQQPNLFVLPVKKFPIERIPPSSTTSAKPKPAPAINTSSGSINAGNNQAKIAKTSRSAHNAIEKRYRASINTRITELYQILVPDPSEPKLSKAGILERAIRHIKHLQQSLKKSREENAWLRKMLDGTMNKAAKGGGEVVMDSSFMCDAIPSPPDSADGLPDSPQGGVMSSDGGSPSHLHQMNGSIDEFLVSRSPSSNNSSVMDSPPPHHQQQQQQSPNNMTRQGMSENKRFVMCLFLMTCVCINPVDKVIGSVFPSNDNFASASASHNTGRSILGYGGSESSATGGWLEWMLPLMIGWLFNGAICAYTLLHLLVWGEPTVGKNSVEHGEYVERRDEASELMRKREYEAAAQSYHQCLASLGRPIPTSALQRTLAFVWNWVRLLLGMCGVDKLMSRCGGMLLQSTALRADQVKTSASLAAHIYLRLDQLNMTGKIKGSRMEGLMYSLTAVNMSQVAGWKLTPPDVAVRIYATAALRFKRHFPTALRWMSWYFIRCSRAVLHKYSNDCDGELRWLVENGGEQFVVGDDATLWSYETDEDDDDCDDFSTIADRDDPLSHAAFHFRKHVMKQALYTLVMPETPWLQHHHKGGKRQTPAAAALKYLKIVTKCEEEEMDEEEDEAESKFWLSVATAAAHYAQGDISEAQQYHQIIEQLPLSLANSRNELPRAVSAAFTAYKLVMMTSQADDDDDTRHDDIMRQCNKASRLLRDNLLNRNNNHNIPMAFRLISCEWVLKSRVVLWEESCCYDDTTRRAPLDQLASFENDLTLFKTIVADQTQLTSKVCIYEASLRMMAGASPIQTQQILNQVMRRRRRCSKRDTVELETGEYEHGVAKLMSCRHLPTSMMSSPGQRSAMLKEACKLMEVFGDHKSFEVATNLLKSIKHED